MDAKKNNPNDGKNYNKFSGMPVGQTNEPNVKKADLEQDAIITKNIKTIHKSDDTE